MKNLLQKWRGLTAGALLVATALTAADGPVVKTLGGGPNQTSSARAGSTDGQTLAFAKFKKPYAAAVDSNGDLFIADFGNGKIRKITKPGAGDSITSTLVSGLASPSGIAIGASNIIYVVTQGDGRLRKYSSDGVLLETISGFRAPTAVALSPAAVALGTNGTVYIAELGGNVYEIQPGAVPMLVGSGFRRPHGIAVLGSGLIAVSESTGHAVQLLDPTTGVSTVIAGGNGAGFADGAVAKFNQPYGLAVAPNGSLVVADKKNQRFRIIGANNVVSTLYGVPKTSWVNPFPGWVDGLGGPNGVAAAREPVGVVVGRDGTVYTTEIYYNLIRQVTSAGLGGDSGIITNIIGTNSVVGTNTISFGFESGEGSSDFVGAAGQSFYAPITLSIAPGQLMYSLQFGVTVTNEGPTSVPLAGVDFSSMLLQPASQIVFTNPFTGELTTNETDYVGLDPNAVFGDSAINLLGIGWLERFPQTNLYQTPVHDLIRYSAVKDHVFDSQADRKVILGGYRFVIPPTATAGDTYRVTLSRASATPKDWTVDVPLRLPTDGSLAGGALNAIKRVSLASRQYVVGDTLPLRWLNAGEFGDGYLVNNDVIQIFESAVYGLNYPNTRLDDSDLFNALDSSSGATNTLFSGDDLTINSITTGDGFLNVDDVFVTFRRSLDPTLKWFARYWSNGSLQVVEVPNQAKPGGQPLAGGTKSYIGGGKSASRPRVDVAVNDVLTTAGSTLEIPVNVQVSGATMRVMMLNLYVEALDGTPVVSQAIQFQTSPVFHAPEFSRSRSGNNYSAAWVDKNIAGYSGSGTLAFLTVKIPNNVGSRGAYRVRFAHFSASPNGLALFESHVSTALILLSDRSASTWNDGISDEWRLRYFGSIYAPDSAPGADADGDGVVNSVEYQNGTNPTDATSF